MSKYIGNIPVPNATQTRTRIVATSGQTSFTTSDSYTPGYIDVFLGGVKLDSSEFTATDGTTVVLASGANTGQIFESISYTTYNLDSTVASQTGNSGKYLTTDGTNTSWADINTSEAPTSFKLKSYTTTQRDALTDSEAGDIIFNTTTGVLEVYGGAGWYAPHAMSIDSVTGDISPGVATTLNFTGTGLSSTVDIRYYDGATLLATSSSIAVSSGAFSDTVPSAVYGPSATDDVITIKVVSNGSELFAGTKIVGDTYIDATGGTVTTDGDYKIHTFTSSDTFTISTLGSDSTYNVVEYLIVAGGGGGGSTQGGGGGGGAGGYRTATGMSVSAQAYTVTVGAGGTGIAAAVEGRGGSGGDSTFNSITSTGGGAGGGYYDGPLAGGSGGGASYLGGGAAGTSGQGNAGGNGSPSGGVGTETGGGGGGAGAVGGTGALNNPPAGGAGLASSITGASTYYAGGGGSGSNSNVSSGAGGAGGIGGGGAGGHRGGPSGVSGTINTGGGGGGAGYDSSATGAGGAGIVIIRYKYQ
jgi:hypothetical protein